MNGNDAFMLWLRSETEKVEAEQEELVTLRTEVAALREQLTIVELVLRQEIRHRDGIINRVEQRLATVTPIVEAFVNDYARDIAEDLDPIPSAVTLYEASAWLASQAHESAPAAVDGGASTSGTDALARFVADMGTPKTRGE